MTQTIDWLAVSPLLCLVGAAVVALLVDAFVPRTGWLSVGVGLVGVLTGLAFTADLAGENRLAFCMAGNPIGSAFVPVDCSWNVNDVTVAWWVLVLIATGLVLLLTQPAIQRDDLPAGELVFLLLTSATGALALAASRDLITLVVAMETVSLPAFALVGLRRGSRRGAEAALKFFIASVVATAFTLLGISMVYGATGSVAAGSVASSVATGHAVSPAVAVGMVLTLVGLAFKVAVVPFQVWVPDTYVGAPVPVAAYLSVVSKAAGLAGLAIVLVGFFPSYASTWTVVAAVAAALTMTVGNVAALRQRHAVRLLAWSSVAQAGYLLVPLAGGGTPSDIGRLQVYALMYAIVNLGAFAVVSAMSDRGAVTIDDYSGLARREPLLGIGLSFALLCLAGLPPGVVGLLAKVVVFQSAVDGSMTWLAVVVAVNVAIGLVYYLRWIAITFRSAGAPAVQVSRSFEGADVSVGGSTVVATQVKVEARPRTPTAGAVQVVIGLTLAAAVVLSIVPAPLFSVLP